MTKPLVSIIMGSDSDLSAMNQGVEVLKEFDVSYEIQILSAHRSPHRVSEFAENAASQGIKVIIAGAGGAAHLAGVVAAHTTLPVIGVPLNATPLNGLDSLLSTVQMPAGIPVATMAVGNSGPKNAAVLAVQMLALSDENLRRKLVEYKKRLADGVRAKNEKLRSA